MKTAKDYDEMTDGVELPDDPKPVSVDALRARKRAIRERRLSAPPRSETGAKPAPRSGTKHLAFLNTTLAEVLAERDAKYPRSDYKSVDEWEEARRPLTEKIVQLLQQGATLEAASDLTVEFVAPVVETTSVSPDNGDDLTIETT